MSASSLASDHSEKLVTCVILIVMQNNSTMVVVDTLQGALKAAFEIQYESSW